MSASLPSALRERFRHYIDEGFSGRAAAAQLRISAVTGSRWACGIRQRGRAMPLKQGRPAGRGKPSPYQAFIEELVAQDPETCFINHKNPIRISEIPYWGLARITAVVN